jgi:hypothetical protein
MQDRVINTRNYKKHIYAVCNRSLINVGFAELKGGVSFIKYDIQGVFLKYAEILPTRLWDNVED